MLRRILLLATSLMFTQAAFGEYISMDLYTQKQSQWCWAAVSQTVRDNNQNFFRLQCKMASAMHTPSYSSTYCCGSNNYYENNTYSSSSTIGSRCNKPNSTQRALEWNNVYQKTISGPGSSTEIAKQLSFNDPVVVSVGWDSGGGHAMVIYGANTRGIAGATYNLWNPGRGRGSETIHHSSLRRYRNSGTWRTTYFTN